MSVRSRRGNQWSLIHISHRFNCPWRTRDRFTSKLDVLHKYDNIEQYCPFEYLLIKDVASLMKFNSWKVEKSMKHRLMPVEDRAHNLQMICRHMTAIEILNSQPHIRTKKWCYRMWWYKITTTMMLSLQLYELMLQCGAVITRLIFSQILTINTPYLGLTGEVWGVCCEFTLCNISVTTMRYATSCHIGPRYSGTRLYFAFCPTSIDDHTIRENNWSSAMTTVCNTLKTNGRHIDNLFVTGCTWGCPNDNLGCSQWREGCQYDDLLGSV